MNPKEGLRYVRRYGRPITAGPLLLFFVAFCTRNDQALEFSPTPLPTDVPVRELQFKRPKPTATATPTPESTETPTPKPTATATPLPPPVATPTPRREFIPTPTSVVVIIEPTSTNPPELVEGLNYEWAKRVIDLTNQARGENNLLPLRVNGSLMKAAEKYAEVVFESGDFTNHYLNDTDPTERAQKEGYNGGVGEVMSTGDSIDNADEIVDAWLRSPLGHREAILSPDFRDIGTGCFEGTRISDFGFLYHVGVCVEDLGIPY